MSEVEETKQDPIAAEIVTKEGMQVVGVDLGKQDSTVLSVHENETGKVTDLVVIASNPGEMQDAQKSLISWAVAKVAELVTERDDYSTNLTVAKKNKWNTKTIERALQRTEKRVLFYSKIKSALEAGFCIIPNFPIEVFAIRTSRKNPRKNLIKNANSWSHPTQQETNAPPPGDGRYVSPVAEEASKTVKVAVPAGQPDKTTLMKWAEEFQGIDFPFDLAKPRVLQSTSRAMTLKVFDEMGILPAQRHGDPMVIGRVRLKEGYDLREVSFLVSWFVDTKEI
jgi:hypothetical protein